MKKNISPINRTIRAIIGLAIIGVGVYYKNWLGFLGLLPLLSAAFGYCALCCNKEKSCSMPKKTDEHKHGDGCCHH